MDVTSLFIEEKITDLLISPVINQSKNQVHGNSIGTLATSRYFMASKTSVNQAAEVFETHKDLDSLGVVSSSHKVIGILTRKGLFSRLGRMYGRSICYYKAVEDYIEEPDGIFKCTRNIFSIASEINHFLNHGEAEYFLLLDNKNQFYGIFRNLDMMIHLTAIESRNFNFSRTVMEHIVKKESLFNTDNTNILCASQQAKGVGGDYYYATQLNNNKWLFSIWDISGKGVASALVVAFLSGIFRFHDFKSSHKVFLEQLNNQFYKTFPQEWFSTGIFVSFNGATKRIKYYDFGHSLCLVYRKGKAYPIKTIKSSVPIGLTPTLELNANYLQLKSGDVLFLYTDGLIEQTNTKGMDYSIKRVHRIILNGIKSSHKLKTIKEKILFDVNQFRESQPQRDDMTFIILQVS